MSSAAIVPSRLVVGVGGGIAAFKSAALVSRLVQQGHQVRVAMTRGAAQFVAPATFAALSGQQPAIDLFDVRYPLGAHIELAEGCDGLIVAPATARLLASFAHGLADDLLATLYLQMQCPVWIAPAMSDPMWHAPAVQRNLERLRQDGVHVIGPAQGWLSCRKIGDGRMVEPEQIVEEVHRLLQKGSSAD
jgi:phosphopantothenoylcysteine decarboxylase/phosphopantothenate--cysteine ligase